MFFILSNIDTKPENATLMIDANDLEIMISLDVSYNVSNYCINNFMFKS